VGGSSFLSLAAGPKASHRCFSVWEVFGAILDSLPAVFCANGETLTVGGPFW